MTSSRRIIGILLAILLSCMLVFCASYIALSIRAANRESARQRVLQLRGEFSYLHEYAQLAPLKAPEAEVSEWLRDRIGDRLFSTPWRIDFGGSDVADSDLSLLKNVPEIRVLGASGCDIGDMGMRNIASLEKLEALVANDTNITDASAHCWEDLVNLKILILRNTRITDASVPELAKLHQLEVLNVHGTDISPTGVERLRELLPSCQVN